MVRILTEFPLIFMVESDLLEERRDVFYYHPRFLETSEELKKSKWELTTLGNIAESIKDGPGGWDFHVSDYVEKGLPMLRILNIKEEGLVLKDLVYISEETHANIKRSEIGPQDVLLSMRGTIGISTVVPNILKKANINAALARIRLKEGVNPYYVSVFLNSKYGRMQTKRGGYKAVQHDLNLSIIKAIKIPLPPKQIQNQVSKIMLDAFKKRNQNLKKADSIIKGISNLLLNELSIELPLGEDRKAYWLDARNLQHRRDPLFYYPKYLNLLNTIESSPYEVKSLKEISKAIVSGQRPKGGVKYIETGVPSIGGEHITSEGDFNFEEIKYIPKQFHENQKKSWIKPFDILIVKDGATTGKVAIIPEDFPLKECNINEHVFKVEVKGGYNRYYMFSYLFSSLGQEQINRLISGATQKGITREAIEQVKIIVPPSEFQDKIADDVKKRKEKSKKLKEEAEEVVEKAKKQVKKMMVGKS